MTDYPLVFEHLYRKMMHYDMKLLPDVGLRFKLSDGTQITDDRQKPFLTFSNDLNFKRIKSALKRLFTSYTSNQHDELIKFIVLVRWI